MKKGIALLLALAMCLSLCACGGASAQTMTMDEMLAVAEEADAVQISKDCSDNLARAKESYCGKVATITGNVRRTDEDYLIIGAPGVYNSSAVVYLPTEDLISIESGQKITVVGKVDDELTEIDDMNVLNLKNAYLVTDRYEVSGANFGPNFSFYPAINFGVEENHTGGYDCCLLYLKDEATLAKVGQLGYQEIFTVIGKIQYDGSGPVGYDILDAVLVE